MVFNSPSHSDHEQVSHFTDPETGLEAIVAIHDTTLGPSLGGTRFLDYDTPDDALEDVLRLSHAMTYKAAAADLPLGGGKAVILGDPDEIEREALFEAYGRAVDCLAGRYITSVDVNSGVADMDVIARETDHVVGTSGGGVGDPSPITAHGVYHGIRACIESVYGTPSVDGREVVIQGLGKVGRSLAEALLADGAAVTVADTDEDAAAAFAREHDAETVGPDAVYDRSCDVFAPCAVGGVINDETIPRLDCEIVAGGANNILAERRHAAVLREQNILYAPDYVINGAGLITVAKEHLGGTREEAYEEAAEIGDRLLEMIELADDRETTVLDAADAYAEARLEEGERTTPAIPS